MIDTTLPPAPAPLDTTPDDGAPLADEPHGRLLRLAASCPRCASRPALRITEEMVRALRAEPARRRLGTYQCQRRGCGFVYDLFAAAYRGAH